MGTASIVVWLGRLHYNCCRRQDTLKMMPAMVAGVTDEAWSLARLTDEIGVRTRLESS
jgi:hypothetical protein